jgi:hypothetical protein
VFSCPLTFIEIFEDSVTIFVPLNHVTSGLGLAVQMQRSVISVPDSFGIIRGFSINDGAIPEPVSPPEIKMKSFSFKIFHIYKDFKFKQNI